MLNTETTEYSNQYIDEQIAFLKDSRPYIREVYLNNINENFNADYIYRRDAVGLADFGTGMFSIQFKNRLEGHNDFVISALKLTGKDALEQASGFFYNGVKYCFHLLADIYVERLGDGSMYSLTAEELSAFQAKYPEILSASVRAVVQTKKKDSNGNYFLVPEYDIYLPQSLVAEIQFTLTCNANRKINDYFVNHPLQ